MVQVSLSMRIEGLIYRGNSLLQGLSYELSQLETPIASVAKNFLSEGAGEVIAEIFGTRKAKKYGKQATRALITNNINGNRQAIISKYEGLVDAWERDIINFLQQVSAPKQGLTAPGNSRKLMQRVAQGSKYKKPDTRIQHMIAELQSMQREGLVYNSTLPPLLPKPSEIDKIPDADKVLHELETALRKFILTELGKLNIDWWQQVPSDIRDRVVGRKLSSQRKWPWHPPTSDNLIDYLDFSDYQKVITDPDNWRDVFSKYFKKPSFIEVRLGELDPIRNDIAHSRQLSKLALDKLKIYSAELISCMKSI